MDKESKRKNLKQLGFFTISLSLIFWSFLFFYGSTTYEELIMVEGEFNDSRKVQIVKKSKIGSNKSTVISLKSYSNIEFNLGETFEHKRLLNEIEVASDPIIIKLNIQE